MATPQELLESLRQVKYPGFTRDIVSFGMVRDIQIGSRGVTIELTTSSENAEAMEAIRREIADIVNQATGLPVEIVVETSRPTATAMPAQPPREKPGIGDRLDRRRGVRQEAASANRPSR
jgi:ATP-binding protein involved in chromosome partitioning